MRWLYITALILLQSNLWGQIHNRLIKLNIGTSSEQIELKRQIERINDTSAINFEFVSSSPTISYSHEFIFGSILSLTAKAGFQYFNIFKKNKHFGCPHLFLAIGPQFSIIYRKKFEYYMKLQIGANYWFYKAPIVNPIINRVFPEKASIFTGVTLGGFNYYMNDQLGLNLELSLWQPELVSFGFSYRFYHGEIPSIQELQGI